MPETRCDYYKVPEVEWFMVNILEKKGRVEPVFDLKVGYRYPEVEETIKMDAGKTIGFLEKLYNVEILGREIYDMELRCPTCNSPNVSINYVCPHCGSSIIRRTILLEHYACGYLGTATSFGEPLVCPKCGVHIEEGDYSDVGSIYECSSCKKQIETPFVSHWCRGCGLKFSFENAVYQPKYAYFPTELTRKEMANGILYLYQVVDVFEEQGLARDVNPKVVGESGVEHVFDAVFVGFGAKFHVDIMFSLDLMSELDFLRECGKIRDVKADVYMFVLPGLDDKAAALAKSYKINVIEGAKPEIVLSKLRTVLAEKMIALKKKGVKKPKRRWLSFRKRRKAL